jgi:hypothetical protein
VPGKNSWIESIAALPPLLHMKYFQSTLRRPVLFLAVGSGNMPRFKVGDRVERIGSLIPEYMRSGVVVRVIPNEHADWFSEYEVNFGNQQIATFYETQLRPANEAPDVNP